MKKNGKARVYDMTEPCEDAHRAPLMYYIADSDNKGADKMYNKLRQVAGKKVTPKKSVKKGKNKK